MAGPAPTDTAALSVRSVSFSYGTHQVLHDVSFDVRAGEFVGIIGPNGSGKSTLLSLLMNLHRASSGEVHVGARRIDRLPTPRLADVGIATTFQLPRSFRSMSVMENMVVAVRGGASKRRAARAKALELLATVNLAGFISEPAGSLSAGQQKLLDLARALMSDPRILLLDEVTAGVHPDLIPPIVEVVKAATANGASAILITHELNIARQSCTRLLGLHNGRIIADGSPEEVLAHEKVLDAYLGA